MLQPKRYTYRTGLKWAGDRKGTTSGDGKHDICVACPPEFGGHEGLWSPEDLFVASVELCMMTTFLWLLEKRGLAITSYASSAEGTAQLSGGAFVFTEIVVKPVVTVSSASLTGDIGDLLKETAGRCMVSSSIKAAVKVEPSILIDGGGA